MGLSETGLYTPNLTAIFRGVVFHHEILETSGLGAKVLVDVSTVRWGYPLVN